MRTAFEVSHDCEGLHGFYALDLRDLLLENALDTVRQRQLRHRTAGTRTDKPDLHDATFDVNKLDIAAIGLERRTNAIEHFLNLLFH